MQAFSLPLAQGSLSGDVDLPNQGWPLGASAPSREGARGPPLAFTAGILPLGMREKFGPLDQRVDPRGK